MIKNLILIFIAVFVLGSDVNGQQKKDNKCDSITFMYDSFIIDDKVCHQVIKNNIMITVTVELVQQYGRFIRIKMEVANLSNRRITFYPKNVKAKILYDDIPYNLEIFSYERFMNRVKRRSTMLSVLRDLGSQAGFEVYSIKDYTEWIYGKYKTSSLRQLNPSTKTVFGRDFVPHDSKLNYVKGSNDNLNIDIAYAGGDYYRYRTELTRHYLRGNSLNSLSATGGYLMIKRRPGDKFYLEIDVENENFKFEWSLKEERDNKKKDRNSTFYGW